jgi:DNA-binding response OmpR family regulator
VAVISLDVVVLDVMLPGLDGSRLCRQLRRHGDVPIIMLTARGDDAGRTGALPGRRPGGGQGI